MNTRRGGDVAGPARGKPSVLGMVWVDLQRLDADKAGSVILLAQVAVRFVCILGALASVFAVVIIALGN